MSTLNLFYNLIWVDRCLELTFWARVLLIVSFILWPIEPKAQAFSTSKLFMTCPQRQLNKMSLCFFPPGSSGKMSPPSFSRRWQNESKNCPDHKNIFQLIHVPGGWCYKKLVARNLDMWVFSMEKDYLVLVLKTSGTFLPSIKSPWSDNLLRWKYFNKYFAAH